MTLPPSRIGDKGQRYEVRWREPEDARDTWRVLGFASKASGAREMRDAWWTFRNVDDVWIVDRETGKRVD